MGAIFTVRAYGVCHKNPTICVCDKKLYKINTNSTKFLMTWSVCGCNTIIWMNKWIKSMLFILHHGRRQLFAMHSWAEIELECKEPKLRRLQSRDTPKATTPKVGAKSYASAGFLVIMCNTCFFQNCRYICNSYMKTTNLQECIVYVRATTFLYLFVFLVQTSFRASQKWSKGLTTVRNPGTIHMCISN